MKILVKVSGSISAYKICGVVSRLVKEGHELRVAASESSLKFVGASTWEGLTGKPVFENDFDPNRRMDHINLNDWADLVVLAPASAQTLNAISSGVGSSVLTTLFLARKKETPYLIFPAMNPRMWESDSVQNSVNNLSSLSGVKVFEPSEGRMACGHVGLGRLSEPDEILEAIYLHQPPKKLKALVTFGGTEEAIDGVRSIGNFSTGKTGLEICNVLRAGFDVTALGSDRAWRANDVPLGLEQIVFKSTEELSSALYSKISGESFDLIVHAAAVSDFIPNVETVGKIASDADLKINWSKAPKVLEQIREVSKNKEVKLVSFKLTHNQTQKVIKDKIEKQLSGPSDYVVHNELGDIAGGKHPFTIWKAGFDKAFESGDTKQDLARTIAAIGRG